MLVNSIIHVYMCRCVHMSARACPCVRACFRAWVRVRGRALLHGSSRALVRVRFVRVSCVFQIENRNFPKPAEKVKLIFNEKTFSVCP